MKLLLYAFTIFTLKSSLVEATINICIPLHFADLTTTNTHELFQDITNDIAEKLNVEENAPDFSIDHLDVNITHPAIRLNGTADNITVYNVQNFSLCFLENPFLNDSYYYKFDLFNLTFANVTVKGFYNLTGDLGDIFDIYGIGDFWISLTEFSIAVTDFRLDLGDELCVPVNIDIDLHNVTNHFSNLMDDEELEELFNGVIANILPESLKIVWSELKDIFDKPIEDAINDIFHKRNVMSIFTAKESGSMRSSCYYAKNHTSLE